MVPELRGAKRWHVALRDSLLIQFGSWSSFCDVALADLTHCNRHSVYVYPRLRPSPSPLPLTLALALGCPFTMPDPLPPPTPTTVPFMINHYPFYHTVELASDPDSITVDDVIDRVAILLKIRWAGWSTILRLRWIIDKASRWTCEW